MEFDIKQHCINILSEDVGSDGSVPYSKVKQLLDLMDDYYKSKIKPSSNFPIGSVTRDIDVNKIYLKGDGGQTIDLETAASIGFENKYKPRNEDIFKKG